MFQYLCVVAPALFAGLVQGVTGFGAGILLMMFYPFCFSIVQSSAMCQLLCAILCISIVWRYQKFVRFRMCLLPLVFYFPIYLTAAGIAARLDLDSFKAFLGLFLILLSGYLIRFDGKIKILANPGTAFVCAALAGTIDAFFGIGGPTMVVYFMAVLKEKKTYLGTIQFFFMTTNLYGTAVRTLAGQLTGDMLLPLAAGATALLLGAYAGSQVVDKIDVGKMKLLVYGFIGFAGVVTFIAGF